jgi:hypothetical protein
MFLDLRMASGKTQEPSWEMGGALPGEYTTLNIGECPNAVVDSRLWQILEEAPHPKYNLSQKACAGILKRAEKRHRELPEALLTALRKQALL